MFEYIPLLVALGGSSLAAAWDLKTTEIPDVIPHAMIAFAIIFYVAQSYLAWSYWPLLNSVVIGLALLAIGFVLYYTGQWGGGDAKILAAIGFLLPTYPIQTSLVSFSFSYFINVFLIGAAYMIIYALFMAIMNKKIIYGFFKKIEESKKIFTLGFITLFASLIIVNFFIMRSLGLPFSYKTIISNSAFPSLATACLFLVWKFARTVEEVGFRKKIKISQLKVGDVLFESKVWDGITEKELKKIRASKKRYIWIKEGVRFAPTFPLALLFTIYFGDGFLVLLKFFM
jgi:Flp pilus assembly protein protease CpaA